MKLAVGPPWLRLTVTARDPELGQRISANLAQAGAEEVSEVKGRVVTVEPAAERAAAVPPETTCAGDEFRIRREGSEGRYDLGAGRGEVRLTHLSGAFFETFLRQVFLWECYRMGGLVLHSVAFATGDDAVVSSGPSDSGKSTLARMLGPVFAVYSDEMNVVTADGRVWGLPFRGTGVEMSRAGGGRLVAATFHRPGPTFASEALSATEAARYLWPNVFVPDGADAGLKLAAFESVAALAQRAPAFAVGVPLDEAATREGFGRLIKNIPKDGSHET